ncbi:MAG: hypothetical protein CFE34_05605 [Rhodobacteraceae bacterium PARR1]|nr:MAG: hypothetical protein CFE34_05605 [Rhodobacteraceae bacterium PARR1]
MADTSANTFAASVSVLSPDQTGFIIGGQVAVNGVGTGALTLSRSVANMNLTGAASSGLEFNNAQIPGLVGAGASATVNSELDFTREITTSGAMVGLGSVIARGEAIASLGSAGAASADTGTSGTTDTASGTSSASAASQGSLNGSLSTANTLQLLGTSGLFAGANGLTVGEANTADAYGSSSVIGDGSSGVNLGTASLVNGSGSGFGALFDVTSDLTGADNEIAISVSNAGNGTVSITTSTGGFFTGGGAASGEGTRNQTGSFFSSNNPL